MFHSERAIYPVLLASVFIIAACGILYELLLSSISSYFLGNSILQFSLTIGLFLFFMGVGSFLSKYLKENLFETFITVEIILGVIGGISATSLYLTFAYSAHYYLYNFIFIALIGSLIGLEIPIVARIINKYSSLKETVAKVFSFDYIGALAASVLFPLVLLPWLGVIKTAFLIGIINLFIAFYNALFFRKILKNGVRQALISAALIVVFGVGIYFAPRIDDKLEQKIYQDRIIYKTQTQYQHIVVTRWNTDYRLFINGAIQFSSSDEYRYHESLVHLPMNLALTHEKILVLGGGDGLVIREILKYPDVKEVHLVDLDPAITDLAKTNDIFTKLNDNSMNDPRVKIFNEDAYNFIQKSSEVYSAIIIDLPDPNDTGLGKLYTKEFYMMLAGRLDKSGVLVTQATSPYFSNKAYWCVVHTLGEVFEHPLAYQTNVPTFGIWGFVAAGKPIDFQFKTDSVNFKKNIAETVNSRLETQAFSKNLRYLNSEIVPTMLTFERDLQESETEINLIGTQQLVKYYMQSADMWR